MSGLRHRTSPVCSISYVRPGAQRQGCRPDGFKAEVLTPRKLTAERWLGSAACAPLSPPFHPPFTRVLHRSCATLGGRSMVAGHSSTRRLDGSSPASGVLLKPGIGGHLRGARLRPPGSVCSPGTPFIMLRSRPPLGGRCALSLDSRHHEPYRRPQHERNGVQPDVVAVPPADVTLDLDASPPSASVGLP